MSVRLVNRWDLIAPVNGTVQFHKKMALTCLCIPQIAGTCFLYMNEKGKNEWRLEGSRDRRRWKRGGECVWGRCTRKRRRDNCREGKVLRAEEFKTQILYLRSVYDMCRGFVLLCVCTLVTVLCHPPLWRIILSTINKSCCREQTGCVCVCVSDSKMDIPYMVYRAITKQI